MTKHLDLLEAFPNGQGPGAEAVWRASVEDALGRSAQGWLDVVGPYGSESMPSSAAWPLLGWVETTASRIAREHTAELVPLSAFALSLLGASPIDPRECWIVGSLVRRGCVLADLPFVDLVGAGCARAGDLGAQCESWLIDVSPSTPSTHREVRDASGRLGFERVPTSIDVERLQRWVDGGRR